MKRAFTLIELLVVIAIIGILATVVVVNLGGARQKAKVAKTKTDLIAYRTAFDLYFDDNNEKMPCPNNEGTNWLANCLVPALSTYANLPANDAWGNPYYYHNPDWGYWGDSECAFILSAGSDNKFCDGSSGVNCNHTPNITSNCSSSNPSYDDIGMYFGKINSHPAP